MKYVQLVIGPAGSGKSTYCNTIQQHCDDIGRSVHILNLDPAAEHFSYRVSLDIRDLVSLDDVTEDEELNFGPNGGLLYCMEFLTENLTWLRDELEDYDEDYIIIDCPGQIELYSHFDYMKTLVNALQEWDFRVCCVYLMDAQFMADSPKFFAGVLSALSAMIRLEVPHINVLTKMDLVEKPSSRQVERFFHVDSTLLTHDSASHLSEKFYKLNEAIANLVDEWSLVNFIPIDRTDHDSVAIVLSQIDNAIQFGEDAEPKEEIPDIADDDDV
eukprot:CFRG1505T1